MTGAPAAVGPGRAAAELRGLPALEPDEVLWLERYVDRLKKAPGGLLKRLVVYGSKARGDAGPESDVDVLVLVGDVPDAVPTARGLSYGDDDPDTVDYSVVVRTEADWLRDLDRELPFPRNVEAEGVQLYPVYRPPRRSPGDLPPVTRKGVRHAVPVWLKAVRWNLKVLDQHFELFEDGRFRDHGVAARLAFDAVFFAAMAWCLVRGVSVVRRRDLPAGVEGYLIEPGVLDPGWRDRIRTLWEAWKAGEVDRARAVTPNRRSRMRSGGPERPGSSAGLPARRSRPTASTSTRRTNPERTGTRWARRRRERCRLGGC